MKWLTMALVCSPAAASFAKASRQDRPGKGFKKSSSGKGFSAALGSSAARKTSPLEPLDEGMARMAKRSSPGKGFSAASGSSAARKTSPLEPPDEGMALMANRRFEEAGLFFERVIDADPNALESWSALGVCMAELGEPDAALVCQKQVLRLRGVQSAGGEEAYREREFESLASTGIGLPSLPDGRRLTLELGSLDACDTGGRLWSSAIALCQWQQTVASELRGRAVLELGCGTGAVGLHAAALGARRVTLTDGGPAALLELVRNNIEANKALWNDADTEVHVVPHAWGEPADAAGLYGHDWVLGSDLTYAVAAQEALCASIGQQLRDVSAG